MFLNRRKWISSCSDGLNQSHNFLAYSEVLLITKRAFYDLLGFEEMMITHRWSIYVYFLVLSRGKCNYSKAERRKPRCEQLTRSIRVEHSAEKRTALEMLSTVVEEKITTPIACRENSR